MYTEQERMAGEAARARAKTLVTRAEELAAKFESGKGNQAELAEAKSISAELAELRRFGQALGARAETLEGLSGLGDLLLTCGSPQSRNMSLGRALGQGQSIAEILGARRSVAEGVYTAAAVTRRARELGIEMPIAEAIHAIVEGRSSVDQEIEALMSRPLRAED